MKALRDRAANPPRGTGHEGNPALEFSPQGIRKLRVNVRHGLELGLGLIAPETVGQVRRLHVFAFGVRPFGVRRSVFGGRCSVFGGRRSAFGVKR
jgi:hypothetical protein